MWIDRAGKAEESEQAPNFSEVLSDCLASGLVAVDGHNKIVAFNPRAELLTGLKADQVLHHSMDVLPAPLQEAIQETLRNGEPVLERQIILPIGDRGESTVRVSTALNRPANENTSGVFVVLNDLTSARRLEQSMRRLDRLASIGTLSASMAHEIKNALVAVRTFVDLLLQKNQDAELVDIVSREIRRIDSIVSQMLRFAGPAKPTFGHVHVHEILDQSLRLVQHQIEGRKISLSRSFAASPDLIKGDAYQLEQAFINLFFNALEAMGPSGELSVVSEIVSASLSSKDGPAGQNQPLLRVAIRDTGVGIAPENLGRLFEPFFTTKPNGTGLGLSITRRIIQEHGGVINVESELNKGTTFTILLPLAAKAF